MLSVSKCLHLTTGQMIPQQHDTYLTQKKIKINTKSNN